MVVKQNTDMNENNKTILLEEKCFQLVDDLFDYLSSYLHVVKEKKKEQLRFL